MKTFEEFIKLNEAPSWSARASKYEEPEVNMTLYKAITKSKSKPIRINGIEFHKYVDGSTVYYCMIDDVNQTVNYVSKFVLNGGELRQHYVWKDAKTNEHKKIAQTLFEELLKTYTITSSTTQTIIGNKLWVSLVKHFSGKNHSCSIRSTKPKPGPKTATMVFGEMEIPKGNVEATMKSFHGAKPSHKPNDDTKDAGELEILSKATSKEYSEYIYVIYKSGVHPKRI